MPSNDLMAYCQNISEPKFLITICQKSVKNNSYTEPVGQLRVGTGTNLSYVLLKENTMRETYSNYLTGGYLKRTFQISKEKVRRWILRLLYL